MKTKYTLFRRGEVFYIQDSANGKQTSLRTKDETEAKSLLEAARQRTSQRERMMCPEAMPLAAGLGDGASPQNTKSG